ncbi:MAG: thioredoxin family protein [Fuerstiella sp.]
MSIGIRGILAVVVVCGIGLERIQAQGAEGWLLDFEDAEHQSKSSNVPLLVHFYADWCGPCKLMERDVLGTPEVSAALGSGIVAVKVNSDRRKDLVARFGIKTLPTDVFVSPSGKVMARYVGSSGRSGYLARLARFSRPELAAGSQATVSGEAIAAGDTTLPPRPPLNNANPVRPASEVRKVRDSSTASSTPATDVVATTAHESSGAETGPETAPTDMAASENSTRTAVVSMKSDLPRLTGALRRERARQIGLNGYCPVCLSSSSEWRRGAPQFRCDYQGVSYLLRSAQDLKRFKADPERFVPVLHGYDPVVLKHQKKMQTGAIELGARYRNRIFFFATQGNREAFIRNPGRYSKSSELSFFRSATDTNTDL